MAATKQHAKETVPNWCSSIICSLCKWLFLFIFLLHFRCVWVRIYLWKSCLFGLLSVWLVYFYSLSVLWAEFRIDWIISWPYKIPSQQSPKRLCTKIEETKISNFDFSFLAQMFYCVPHVTLYFCKVLKFCVRFHKLSSYIRNIVWQRKCSW